MVQRWIEDRDGDSLIGDRNRNRNFDAGRLGIGELAEGSQEGEVEVEVEMEVKMETRAVRDCDEARRSIPGRGVIEE